MELLVRAGGFAESAKQENVVIVRYEGSTASRILFNYKTFVSGKKWNKTFGWEIATSSSFHSASKQKLTFKQRQFIGNKLQPMKRTVEMTREVAKLNGLSVFCPWVSLY